MNRLKAVRRKPSANRMKHRGTIRRITAKKSLKLKKHRRSRLNNRRKRKLRRAKWSDRRRHASRRTSYERSVMTPPLVSVIMPSYNQAAYIRQAIESIIGQNYPRLELIVVDGGSSDETVDILKSYAHLGAARFRYVSEPDRGQAHALNKGISMAGGTLLGWLNSDDTYCPGAVNRAVRALSENPGWAGVYGHANYIDEAGAVLYPYPTKPFNAGLLYEECFICQPAAFLRKDAVMQAGGWDESFKFCMDYDLWIRLSKNRPMGFIKDLLANSRLHKESKSTTIWKDTGLPEVFRLSIKNFGRIANKWVAEYAHHHWPKGILWLLEQYKAHHVFGPSPVIADVSRYEDSWLPQIATLKIKPAGIGNMVHSLLIEGRHEMPRIMDKLHFTAFVNGKPVQAYEVQADSFVLEIPVHSDEETISVEIHTHERFCPAEYGLSSDDRMLGFVGVRILPLAPKEFEFYRAYKTNPSEIPIWLLHFDRT